MNTGIYAITHKSTGRCYVGSAKNLRSRKSQHFKQLEKKTHHSKKLQNACNKYGLDAFEFSTLLYCDQENLLMYEQILIDAMSSYTKGFNVCPKAGSRLGSSHDKETVSRMRSFQRSYRKKYDLNGQQLCIAEIAEICGVPRDVLYRRVCMDKMPLELAVAKPYKKPNQPIFGCGKELTFYGWVKEIGCTEAFLRLWLKKGLSIEECIAKHKRITPGEFGRLSGMSSNTFLARLRNGWSIGEALGIPVKKSLAIA
jgi:hypothetical protein